MDIETLAKLTAEKTGLSESDTQTTLETALQIISGAVASGEAVRLYRFGTFKAELFPPKEGRTALEAFFLPSTKSVTFTPALAFKQQLK